MSGVGKVPATVWLVDDLATGVGMGAAAVGILGRFLPHPPFASRGLIFRLGLVGGGVSMAWGGIRAVDRLFLHRIERSRDEFADSLMLAGAGVGLGAMLLGGILCSPWATRLTIIGSLVDLADLAHLYTLHTENPTQVTKTQLILQLGLTLAFGLPLRGKSLAAAESVLPLDAEIPSYPIGRYQSVDGGNLNRSPNSIITEVTDTESGKRFIHKLEGSDEDVFGNVSQLPRQMIENEWTIGREIDDIPSATFRRVLRRYQTRGGLVVLILERVDGETLAQVLVRRGRLSPRETVKVGIETLDGLDVLHHHRGGIVHLDLHTENIMLASSGAVKIIDLGIATRMGDISRIDPRNFRGRLGYAAPEAYLRLHLGHQRRRSDIFSFACCLYECLTGQKAFPHASKLPGGYGQLPPPLWKVIPNPTFSLRRLALIWLNRIVFKGLQYRMEDRYRWAYQFRNALKEWQWLFGRLNI